MIIVNMEEAELNKLAGIVKKIKTNYQILEKDVKELKQKPRLRGSIPLRHTNQKSSSSSDLVTVSKKDLLKLQKEVRILKGMLSSTIKQDLLSAYSTLQTKNQEIQTCQEIVVTTENERDHWKSQWQGVVDAAQAQKEEKFALQCELQETVDQLAQQSEFCTSMGSACCTLLWRVSRCEDSIQSILVGSKVDEFMDLVISTVGSYLDTFREEMPLESSDETQFILALCGTITNIAASAFGRDFLMKKEQGKEMVDTFITVLEQPPCNKLATVKNLILMALYNLTINQKGLKYVSSKPGLLGLLVWQLQGCNDVANRLNSLRLLQSLLYEQESSSLIHEAKEALHPDLLKSLCHDPHKEIRNAAAELLSDLLCGNKEQ